MRSWAVKGTLVLFCSLAAAADRLPGFGADSAALTVSGVSSGGYMAVQMHVAHSSRVKGAAAIAAGPYYCAQASLWTAMRNCMRPGGWSPLPDVNTLKAATDRFARDGAIDATSNLAAGRVWVFSGTRDRTVGPQVVEALGTYYALYSAKSVFVKDKPAGHAMVTESAGNACDATEPPFINDCDYDAAGELLRHLLGPLAPRASRAGGRILAFDQSEFADVYAISMAGTGYAYVPSSCEANVCRVHVVFHGCRQNAEAIGERFVREAGYNRWAETNRLIVLYPQTIARYWWIYNPRACWDWWGYTGDRYATKEAPQMRAVIAMVERLGSKPKER
jgi:poly(3-hydroxybutyrate) depolymerase